MNEPGPDTIMMEDFRASLAVAARRACFIAGHRDDCPKTVMLKLVPDWTGKLADSSLCDADLAILWKYAFELPGE